jgi:choline dehydrogenase
MVYCRGLPGDFDDWAAQRQHRLGLGRRDARSTNVLNVVLMPMAVPPNPGNAGKPADGKLVCQRRPQASCTPWKAPLLQRPPSRPALPYTEDFNGPQPEGVGRYRINTRRGMRWSAADALFAPGPGTRQRSQLQHRGPRQSNVSCSRAAGPSACAYQPGRRQNARCAPARAVVLSAGADPEPAAAAALRRRSRVTLLQRHGIRTVVLVQGTAVGANLQDHLAMSYYYKATQPTLNNVLSSLVGQVA